MKQNKLTDVLLRDRGVRQPVERGTDVLSRRVSAD
jgi:hypothetical protein